MAKKESNKSKLIYYLCLIGFFAIFSTTISKNPVLPLYVRALGGSDMIIGLISAFSPLAGILFSFPVGVLADRLGRKKLLIVSGFVFLIAPLLYLFVTSAVWLIPVRFFHGLATAILGPVVSAIIVKNYSKNKGEKLGLYSSSTLVGRTLAPLVGGFIISYFLLSKNLFSYKLVYLTAFILAIPVFIMIFFLKHQEPNKKSKVGLKEFYQDLKYFLKNKKIASTALVQLAIYFSYGAFETYLPLYLSNYSIPAFEIGLIFAIQILAIALSQPIFGKLADRIDKRIQIAIGVIVLAISIASIALFTSIIPILLIGILFALGLSFSTIATNSYIADVTKKNQLGSSYGGLSSVMDIGQTIGPFLTGIVLTVFSFELAFLLSCAIVVVCVVIFLINNKNKV